MLKAEGRLYALGDKIGLTTRYVKDIEVLRNAITSGTVPLVSTFDQPLGAWNLTQPIGRAKLGFHAVRCDVKDDIVNSMSIIACGVSDSCLGGALERIREE